MEEFKEEEQTHLEKAIDGVMSQVETQSDITVAVRD